VNTPTRILVVDDNAVDRERIRRLMGPAYEVVEAATAREGLEIADQPLDCVLLDHRLPDRDGVDAIEDFVGRGLPVVILTAQGSEHIAVEAMKQGAADYLGKSELDRDRLHRALQGALERQRLRGQVEQRSRELESSNRALAERETHLRMVLEQVPALLWTTDRALRYTTVGGADPPALGIDPSDIIGRSIGGAVIDADGLDEASSAHRQALAGTAARYTVNWRGRSYECSVEPMHAPDGSIIGTVGLGLDRSEAKQNEQRLHHAAKMEALGKLSGGIAHDFNNVLSAIVSFTEMAREGLHREDPIRQDLDEVLRASDRAVALVRQLLAFSRQDRIVPRVVSVGPVMRDLLPMLRRLSGEDLTIELAARDTFSTFMDRGKLEQVVINLVVNARDAMPHGGRIVIETADETVDSPRVEGSGAIVAPGEYVVVAVRDDGVGMPPSVVDRIFEPFFTTKPVGEGTGLGLSTVHGIVSKAGGTITVESAIDRGTVFRVHLPRTTVQPAEARANDGEVVPRGTEQVLVVEDEDQVRAVAVRSLRRLGYRVIEARRGDAVARALASANGSVDLLLTDVVMPGMSGPEVARLVLEASPGTIVLYMSGYSDESMRGRQALPDDATVLEKPLRPDDLGRAVRAALDARAT
jgi:signal transduction histidine kinase